MGAMPLSSKLKYLLLEVWVLKRMIPFPRIPIHMMESFSYTIYIRSFRSGF